MWVKASHGRESLRSPSSFFGRSARSLIGPAFVLTLLGCASEIKPASEVYRPGEWEGKRVVQTQYGLVRGRGDSENTWSWRGIPYAAPPVSDLRWKAPRPPQPWSGVRSATRFGGSCAQSVPILGKVGSEDCLYLNIWRPKSDERMLPVYVYVHGGGNTIGSSKTRDYRGHAVAARSNMVYVSLNYRLSVFGWFRLPAITADEAPIDASGNYGTLDIIAALRWVQENISSFGGDPSRVTLAGESAGAFNVLSLMVSEQARGLFQQGVAESGIAVMQSNETAERAARRMAMKLLVRRGKVADMESARAMLDAMPAAELRSFLYSVSTSELVKCLDKSPMGLSMADWPTVYADGVVLPAEGYRAFVDGSYPSKVPLVIGSNRDEAKLFMYFQKSFRRKSYRERPELYDAVAEYHSLLWRYAGVDYVAKAIVSHSGHPPVYSYRFDWGSRNAEGKSPLPGALGHRLGAFHSTEIPFFLGTGVNAVSFLTGRFLTKTNAPGRKALTSAAMRYLAAFARTGNPNDTSGPPLPAWEQWDPAAGGFKALVMDVDGAELHFSTLRESPSLAAIKALARDLPEASNGLGLLADFAE